MVGLATDYFAAEQLGLSPAGMFDDIPSSLSSGWVPDLLRKFCANDARGPDSARQDHGSIVTSQIQ